jgi:hypothetical protein
MTAPGNKQINYPEAISASLECSRIAENIRDQIAKGLGITIENTADWTGRANFATRTVVGDQQTTLVNLAQDLHMRSQDLKQFADMWSSVDDQSSTGVQAAAADPSSAPTTTGATTVASMINRPV